MASVKNRLADYFNDSPPPRSSTRRKVSQTTGVTKRVPPSVKRVKAAYNATPYIKNRRELPRGVKLMKSPSKVSGTNWKKAKNFVKEVSTLPVYLIAAHSCICKKGVICSGERHPFSFKIPKDTYIVSLVQPGDYACVNDTTVQHHTDEVRMFLYSHGTDDVESHDRVGKNWFSFFGGIQRAVGPSQYPNISYTMNEYGPDKALLPPEKNPSGVYKIEQYTADIPKNNTMSIIPQDANRKNWTLEQVIREVYAAEKIKKAIFISAGCLSGCFGKQRTASLDEAATLMHRANEEYKGLRETLTAEEMRAHKIDAPMNTGTYTPHAALVTDYVKEMVNAGLVNTNYYKNRPLLFDAEDYEELFPSSK